MESSLSPIVEQDQARPSPESSTERLSDDIEMHVREAGVADSEIATNRMSTVLTKALEPDAAVARTALAGLTACWDWLGRCEAARRRFDTKALDNCMRDVPRCETSSTVPITACCPSSCVATYFHDRREGKEYEAAGAFLFNGCYAGLPRRLQGYARLFDGGSSLRSSSRDAPVR
jgi:hypothetical protein